MAERFFAALLTLLSAPVIWLARGAETWNAFGICSDINKCLDVVDSQKTLLPNSFIVSLIAAEDHRNAIHPGVDPIAILRAVYVRWRFGDVQGASTVEQQFVRVVSGRYERTLARKAYEQMLAICVSRRRSKVRIANAYLTIAYYGSSMVGATGLRTKFGSNLSTSDIGGIREMIARLKYPEPSRPTAQWRRKVRARVIYIKHREEQLRRRGPRRAARRPVPPPRQAPLPFRQSSVTGRPHPQQVAELEDVHCSSSRRRSLKDDGKWGSLEFRPAAVPATVASMYWSGASIMRPSSASTRRLPSLAPPTPPPPPSSRSPASPSPSPVPFEPSAGGRPRS